MDDSDRNNCLIGIPKGFEGLPGAEYGRIIRAREAKFMAGGLGQVSLKKAL